MKKNIKSKLIAFISLVCVFIAFQAYGYWEEVVKVGNIKIQGYDDVFYIDNDYVGQSKYGHYLIRVKREHHQDRDPSMYIYEKKTTVEIDTFEILKDFRGYREKYNGERGREWNAGFSRMERNPNRGGHWALVWDRAYNLLLSYKSKEEAAKEEAAKKKEAERLANLPAKVDIVLADKDAKITIDGIYKTNGGWKGELKKGKHTIVVSNKNYRDYKQEVTLSPGEEKRIKIPNLTPIVGALYISSNPEGAKAFLDGKELGETPVLATDIIIGDHEVRIVKEGCDDIVKNINLVEMPADSDEPQILYQQFPKISTSGYQYVDLGLPSGTLWATCNLGAESPMELGDKFGWGQITPVDREISYKKFKKLRKFNKKFAKKIVKSGILDISGNPEYDAARAIMGEPWRMPTKEEIEELIKYCKFEVVPAEKGRYPSAIRVIGNNSEIIRPLNDGNSDLMSGTAPQPSKSKYSKDKVYVLHSYIYNNKAGNYCDDSTDEFSYSIRPVFTPSPEYEANKRNSYCIEIKEAAKKEYQRYLETHKKK